MAKKQFVDEIWNAGRNVARNKGYYNNNVDMWDAFKAFLLYTKVISGNKQFYGSDKHLNYESSMATINSFRAWLEPNYCKLAAACC